MRVNVEGKIMTEPSKEIAEKPDPMLATIYAKEFQRPLFDDDSLAEITTIQDAFDAFGAMGIEPEDFSEYGTGFKVVDKATLVNAPMLILEWRFNNSGDYGDFVSVAAVTQDGRKVVFNDGSTGIRDQLETVTKQRIARGHEHPRQGLKLMSGLRASTYDYTDDKGKTSKATTYYLGNA